MDHATACKYLDKALDLLERYIETSDKFFKYQVQRELRILENARAVRTEINNHLDAIQPRLDSLERHWGDLAERLDAIEGRIGKGGQ